MTISKIFKTDSCNLCTDYTAVPYNYLSKGMLQNMAANYDTTSASMRLVRFGQSYSYTAGRSNHIFIDPSGTPVEDPRSIWFSLDSIKHFIWEIETNVCKNNCTNIKKLGIRLYYARYPKSLGAYPQLSNLVSGYEKLHTIFMIPTFGEGNDNVDFDPRRYDSRNCRFTPMATIESNIDILSFSPIRSTTQVAKNHGTLCPPECNGSAF